MKTMDLIIKLAQQNPEAINNPRSQSLLNILKAGDEARGIEAANNIIRSMGMTKEQAIQQATQGLQNMASRRF